MPAAPALVAVLLAAGMARPQVPFAEARDRAVGYSGPGRDAPDPTGLTEVRLGYFGPSDDHDLEGGSFWRGASLAVEEVNAEGGCSGLPLRLVPAWSASPWSAGIALLTKAVFEERVWAVVGSIDGAASHLAEQVAAKALVTVVSPGSTDETVNLANVPWMFSGLPSDSAQAPILGRALSAVAGDYVRVAATDHDSRAAAVRIGSWLSRNDHAPSLDVEIPPGEPDLEPFAARVAEKRPAAVLVLAGVVPSVRMVRALRRAGYRGRILGGPTFARDAFRVAAGADAEGVVFPLLYQPGERWERFSSRFEQRYGSRPDYAAGQAYDSVRLLAEAVRRAGLNRPRINDAVRGLSPWSGVTGVIRWDPLGRNERAVGLGVVRGGRVLPLRPESTGPSAAPGPPSRR
jgi:branched-chain amino acid transport system substrate-binding protein